MIVAVDLQADKEAVLVAVRTFEPTRRWCWPPWRGTATRRGSPLVVLAVLTNSYKLRSWQFAHRT